MPSGPWLAKDFFFFDQRLQKNLKNEELKINIDRFSLSLHEYQ